MAVVHNVQIYPIHSNHVNDHKVLAEREFDTVAQARDYMKTFNNEMVDTMIAVYTGAIDTETGENLSQI